MCDETESESRPVVALHRGTMSKPKIESFIKVNPIFIEWSPIVFGFIQRFALLKLLKTYSF